MNSYLMGSRRYSQALDARKVRMQIRNQKHEEELLRKELFEKINLSAKEIYQEYDKKMVELREIYAELKKDGEVKEEYREKQKKEIYEKISSAKAEFYQKYDQIELELRQQFNELKNDNEDSDFKREILKQELYESIDLMKREVHCEQEKQTLCLKKQYDDLENNKKEIEKKIEELAGFVAENRKRMKDLYVTEENIRNNNTIISNLVQEVQRLSEKYKENTSLDIDYYDFENQFRGSREFVKQSQKQYLKYFANCNKVLDLGSGRGEFLELLKEHGISAMGVDVYDPFIALCQEKELPVVRADALEYLKQCDFVDGVFASQLIEHLPMGKVVELCKVAYEKLEQGEYMILETPNPMSLAVFTNSFYLDPSHVKPVHPLTLKYIVEKIGFQEVKLVFTENSKMPIKIPKLEIANADNVEDFNESMQKVSEMLFGSQDYALIAKR